MNLDLQLTQPVWFKTPNPRWAMGEETSPLRLGIHQRMEDAPHINVNTP